MSIFNSVTYPSPYGRWCNLSQGYCSLWSCDGCPYLTLPMNVMKCNKGLIMSDDFGNKCNNCEHNPKNCSGFEEMGVK